jgi:hypothetical protein
MRARLFIISSVAIAAVLGASSVNAAHAAPQGPGNLGQTPTTMGPPKPTTTTVPKGPGDLAPKPPKGDNPKPNGPGDIAPAPKDDSVAPGPDTTNPTNPAKPTSGAAEHNAADDDAASGLVAAPASHSMSPFVIILVAAVVGALLALVATRLRRA